MNDVPQQFKKRRWDKDYPDLYQAKNNTWYLRYWSPKLGRELEISLGTVIKTKAVKERKRRLEDLGEEKGREAVGFKKFRDVIRAFKRDIVWDSTGTELAAMNQLDKHLDPWFGGYDPDRIDNNLWRKYAKERRDKDPTCSLFNARKYLWKVNNWAFEKRIVKKKFTPDDFDEGRESPGVEVSETQFKAILSHLNQDWQDIASFGWGMAMRHGEIKRLEWAWIDQTTWEICIPKEATKTRKARSPVAPDNLIEVLKRRLLELEEKGIKTPYVFPGKNPRKAFSKSDRAWQLAKDKAKVECRFHDLRHTWLTKAFKQSNRYAEICEYAGLTLEEALNTYVRFNVRDMSGIASVAEQISTFGEFSGENRGGA